MKRLKVQLTANNDFAKCEGIGCSFKEQCLRHVRPAGKHQVWAEFYKSADDDCVHYLSIPKS